MSKQDIDFKIGADLKQFRSAMGNIDHSLKRLSGGFGALGGVIGASFAVDAIRQFVTESVELAAQAEGVKRAFDRINNPALLDELRTATKGTLNNLELMKAAVKAKNFNIPLNQLGSLLAFAQQRAGETGESIEYMTESIVTGIARKSLPILDNLGFSAVEVREEFNRTGDMAEAVGNIIKRQMGDAGDATLTLSEQIAQQRAEIDNLKIEVGTQLAPVYKSFLNTVKEGFNDINNLISDDTSFFQKVGTAIRLLVPLSKQLGLEAAEVTDKVKTGVEELDSSNKSLTNSNNTVNTSTEGLADTFEKTRNEAYFYTAAIHRLKEAHSMLYKAQGASINQFATASTSFKEFKKTWEDNVIQQGLKEGVDLTYILADAGFDAFTAFEELGNSIGNLLTSSFEAAMISGEDFFKVFIQGLKNMVAQLLATVAAALVLAVILAALPLGLAGVNMQSIGTAFKLFSGPMMGVPSFGLGGGLGGAMQGGGLQVFGRLSGSDILISSERAGRDRTRLSGITG